MKNRISTREEFWLGFLIILCANKHEEALNMVLRDRDFKRYVVDCFNNCPNQEESSVLLGVIKQCCEIGKATITFDEMLSELEAVGLRAHTKAKKASQYKVFNAPQQKVRQCAAG